MKYRIIPPLPNMAVCGQKKCTKCKTKRTTDDFPKRTDSNDGLGSVCLICIRKLQATIRARKREWTNFY